MSYFILFREMWRYAEGGRWKIATFLVLHALSTLGLLATPLVFAQILNTLQAHDEGEVLENVGFWVAVWLGVSLWFNVFHRAGRYFEFDVAYRLKQAFLNRHYAVLTALPLKWHTDHHSGDTIDRVNLAMNALVSFVIFQYNSVQYVMMFWGPLLALSFLTWHLSVIAFAMAVTAITIIVLFDRRLIRLYRTINGINHRIAATLFDYIGNIRTVITLRLENRTAREFDRQIATGYKPFIDADVWVNGTKWFLVSFINALTLAVGVFYYIWREITRGETIQIGNVSAVLQYGQQLTNTFANIARDYQQVVQWRINLEAARDITEALERMPVSSPVMGKTAWRHLSIRDLDFFYDPARPVLRGIALDIREGERIALVGESGSGKSTLMGLLRGLHEPTAVVALFDGQARPDLAPLFATTTLMPQEPEIFENTIGFNIRFGIDYPEEDVCEAVRLARFEPVLRRLPNGLETDVRERGVSLSGGERQRLALARGILAARNSQVILMDEPTSSVDAANEIAVYENVFGHFEGRTVISSIHRLHLLGRFDRVVVMADGRVVQDGPFEALRDRDGPLRDLWMRYLQAANGTSGQSPP